MNSYHAWNLAACSYLTTGIPRGSPVFIHVDASVLGTIGRMLPEPVEAANAEAEFCAVVRAFACSGRAIRVLRLLALDSEHRIPLCLAFLSATVLAATKMRESEDASEGNYFRRLREVLGMDSAPGRPEGFQAGRTSEQPLWNLWNRWLQSMGWLPTASAGVGAYTYIHYPISQALLRVADTERLVKIFALRDWKDELDPSALATALGMEPGGLSAHLRELLARHSGGHNAVQEAIYDLHESWRSSRLGEKSIGMTGTLRAGLLRSADAWSGDINFHLYVQTSRHARAADLTVVLAGREEPLRIERPGWYEAFGDVDEGALNEGAKFPVRGLGVETHLVLPKRRFWTLIPDPDDPDSGAYATWGRPQVGDPFVLLLREPLMEDVETLRDEGLLRWSGNPRPIGGGWVELIHCEQISENWAEVFIRDAELKEGLRPLLPLGLRLTGGLRAPGRRGWMDGFGPVVEVSGYAPEVEFSILSVDNDLVLWQQPLLTGSAHKVPWPGPGDYRVEASVTGRSTRRIVNIVSWDSLALSTPTRPVATVVPRAQVTGARVSGLETARERP